MFKNMWASKFPLANSMIDLARKLHMVHYEGRFMVKVKRKFF
jgi:hypothetical protein